MDINKAVNIIKFSLGMSKFEIHTKAIKQTRPNMSPMGVSHRRLGKDASVYHIYYLEDYNYLEGTKSWFMNRYSDLLEAFNLEPTESIVRLIGLLHEFGHINDWHEHRELDLLSFKKKYREVQNNVIMVAFDEVEVTELEEKGFEIFQRYSSEELSADLFVYRKFHKVYETLVEHKMI